MQQGASSGARVPLPMAFHAVSYPAQQPCPAPPRPTPHHASRNRLSEPSSDPQRGPLFFRSVADSGSPLPAQLRMANPGCTADPRFTPEGPGRGSGLSTVGLGFRDTRREMDFDSLGQSAKGTPEHTHRGTPPRHHHHQQHQQQQQQQQKLLLSLEGTPQQHFPHSHPHLLPHAPRGPHDHSAQEPFTASALHLDDPLVTENKALRALRRSHPSAALQLLGPKDPLQAYIRDSTALAVPNSTVPGAEAGKGLATVGVPVALEAQQTAQDLLLQLLQGQGSLGRRTSGVPPQGSAPHAQAPAHRGSIGGAPAADLTEELLQQLLQRQGSVGESPGCVPGAPSSGVQVPDVHWWRPDTPAARSVPTMEVGLGSGFGAPGVTRAAVVPVAPPAARLAGGRAAEVVNEAGVPPAGVANDGGGIQLRVGPSVRGASPGAACGAAGAFPAEAFPPPGLRPGTGVAVSGVPGAVGGALGAHPASATPTVSVQCLGGRARAAEPTAEEVAQKRRRVMGGDAAEGACGTPGGEPGAATILRGVPNGVPGSRTGVARRQPSLVPPAIRLPPAAHPASLACPLRECHHPGGTPLVSPEVQANVAPLAYPASAHTPRAFPSVGGALARMGPASGTPAVLQGLPRAHQDPGIPMATQLQGHGSECALPCLPLQSLLQGGPRYTQVLGAKSSLNATTLSPPKNQLLASPRSTTADPSSAVTSPRERNLRGLSPAARGTPVTMAVTTPVAGPVTGPATGPATMAVTAPVAMQGAVGEAMAGVSLGSLGQQLVYPGAAFSSLGHQPVYPGAAPSLLRQELGEARREAALLRAKNAALERELAAGKARLAEAVGNARTAEHQAGLLRQCLQHCLQRLKQRWDPTEHVGENDVPVPPPQATMPLLSPLASRGQEAGTAGMAPGSGGVPGMHPHVRCESVDPAESFCEAQAGKGAPGAGGRVGEGVREAEMCRGGDLEDGQCWVCLGKRATVLLIPCRHLTLCKACEPTVKACPACLDTHKAVIHVRTE